MALAMHFGAGVAACYRGPGLYDDPASKALVTKWVAWFRKHQAILTSDIIHLRRPDGQGIDGFIHSNPVLPEPGLAMFFNPTAFAANLTLAVPLYYSGFIPGDKVTIIEADGGGGSGSGGGSGDAVAESIVTVSNRFRVTLQVSLEPSSVTWFTFLRSSTGSAAARIK
jgi:hypothetical protein